MWEGWVVDVGEVRVVVVDGGGRGGGIGVVGEGEGGGIWVGVRARTGVCVMHEWGYFVSCGESE